MVPWTVDHGMKPRTVLGALALATVPLLLATPAQADPTPPAAAEQDGTTFHNVEVASFLPGVVDESWILAFAEKETHS